LTLLGGVLAAPFAARAQQKAVPVIGFLSSGAASPFTLYTAAFGEGLRQSGFVDGQNVSIEYRWAESHYDRLPALAADLVKHRVDLIVASGGFPSARAAKDATSTIPIVFTAVSDPVRQGLVASLAQPGANITGFSIMGSELVPKRLQLLMELAPKATVVGFLVNPEAELATEAVETVRAVARTRALELAILNATTPVEINAAFERLARIHAQALLVGDDPFFTNARKQLVALASQYSLPAIYQWRNFTVDGGLASYGANLAPLYRLAGSRAGKILKGVKPGDIPVEQPAVFEFVINLKAAKALGLTVPQSILARADEVIE
jgi:putative ABC transport system substrate-binding protein